MFYVKMYFHDWNISKISATINTQSNLLSIDSHHQCIELQQSVRLIKASNDSYWNEEGYQKKFWKN